MAEPYLEGHAWGGLLIVHAYDGENGGFAPNRFEIRHQASGEFMLEINASYERAQEIGHELAKLVDWAALSTTDEMMLQARLMAFGAGYPSEVRVYNERAAVAELRRIAPYGPH